MYQQIATFEKNHLIATAHKFATTYYKQNHLDAVAGKPAYRYG